MNLETIGVAFGGVGATLIVGKDLGLKPQFLIEPRTFVHPETIKYNFPELLFINDLKDSRINTLKSDILVGNPSCAQFSPLGMKRKDRGNMDKVPLEEIEFFQFLDLVKMIKPKVFILENVPQIMKSLCFTNNILDTLFRLGDKDFRLECYNVTNCKLNLTELDWPQNRNRVYYVGYQLGYKKTNFFPDWKVEESDKYCFSSCCKDLLFDLEEDYNSEINHTKPNHTVDRINRMAELKYGESYYGTQNNRRLDPDKAAYTITSHCTRHIHYRLPRTLTVRECARLQGFPDSFIFSGNESQQLDQVGKSLAIPAINFVLNRILLN